MRRLYALLEAIPIVEKGSRWLNGAAKNIVILSHTLATLGGKTSVFLFSCLALPIVNAACSVRGSNTLYLNYSQGNSFLKIESYYNLQAMDNICGFFKASKQPGAYQQLACLCPSGFPAEGSVYFLVSGQNVPQAAVQCIIDIIENSCMQPQPTSLQTGLAVGVTLFIVCCCCVICFLCNRKKADREVGENLLVTEDMGLLRPGAS